MDESEARVQGFRVRGRVQGVGFRWWTRKTAEELGLEGSVRNLRDGTVEVRARGPVAALRTFRRRLEQGPSSAVVEGVTETDSSLPLPEGHFRITR